MRSVRSTFFAASARIFGSGLQSPPSRNIGCPWSEQIEAFTFTPALRRILRIWTSFA